jgi:hypothetical protein
MAFGGMMPVPSFMNIRDFVQNYHAERHANIMMDDYSERLFRPTNFLCR